MRNIYAYLLLFVLCFVLYANSLGNGFFLDDYPILINEPFIHNIENLLRITDYIPKAVGDEIKHFRPVSIIFRSVLYFFFKDKAFCYHLINIILFSLYGCLFFRVVQGITKDFKCALISALLFCAHPINHIYINFVTAHEILLLGIFSALSTMQFLLYIESPRSKGRYFLSILFFSLSLLTHEVSILLPVFLFSLAFIVGKKGLKYSLGVCVPYLVCVGIFFVFKFFIARHVFEFLKTDIMKQFSFFEYISSLIYLLGWYLSRLFYPVDIVLIFSSVHRNAGIWFEIFIGLMLMIGLIYAVSRNSNPKSRDIRSIAIIWFFYGFAVLPFLSFVYLTAMGMIIEPHWFFFTSGGFFVLLALALKKIETQFSPKYCLGVLILLICVWGIFTMKYNRLWKTGKSYATYWTSRVRNNPYGLRFLGHVALREGNLEQAEYYLQQVMEYGVNDAVFAELAQVYLKMGKVNSAKRILAQGIKKMPQESSLYNDLGVILFQENHYSEAVQFLEKSIELDEHNVVAWENLADFDILNKNYNRAIKIFEHLLASFSPSPDKTRVYLAKLYACLYLIDDQIGSQRVLKEFLKKSQGDRDIQAFNELCSSLGIPLLSPQVSASSY